MLFAFCALHRGTEIDPTKSNSTGFIDIRFLFLGMLALADKSPFFHRCYTSGCAVGDSGVFSYNQRNSILNPTGLFWMAFWAFALGYLISSAIQIFVTRQRMKRSMGEAGARSVSLATFFSFISSSCSFAALSTTRSLFTKGAGLIPSLAFLPASTNLVIELGIVIAVFLSRQFVVGESEEIPDWKSLIRSREGWRKVACKYGMEWQMVWKDVTIGFTVAGIIAAFVPKAFFQALFIGAGSNDASFFEILPQTLVGPVAAFVWIGVGLAILTFS